MMTKLKNNQSNGSRKLFDRKFHLKDKMKLTGETEEINEELVDIEEKIAKEIA